jgi:HSP20 family protein
MRLRRGSTYNTWEEMERLQREMNQLFNATRPHRLQAVPSFPAMNIWTSEEGQVITAEIPGVDVEDIDISVTGKVLTLSGSRKTEDIADEVRYHRQERGYGRFKRSIQLPFPVAAEQVKATFDKGILTINLPRAEEDKPKKITVQRM